MQRLADRIRDGAIETQWKDIQLAGGLERLADRIRDGAIETQWNDIQLAGGREGLADRIRDGAIETLGSYVVNSISQGACRSDSRWRD